MAFFYTALFAVLVLICVALYFFTGGSGAQQLDATPEFTKFQYRYLLVYYIVMAADWLQGPYVYALYESYGFPQRDIAVLFVGGFLSSLVFGTFVGATADKYGRKNLSLVFALVYGASCITKLFNNYSILMLGRILSGIATSLLFSVFESWMVFEHTRQGFNPEWISSTFSYAILGNSIVAIGSGLIASWVAEAFGFIAPFMVALVLLVISFVVVWSTWSENYGDSRVDLQGTFTNAAAAIRQDTKILILGLVQSLFEGSMYTFVFLWSPTMQQDNGGEVLPFGLIFACFMVAIMIGGSVFKYLLSLKQTVEDVIQILLIVGAGSLAVPILTTSSVPCMLSFIAFEACCGLYFPAMGTLRSKYIPEEQRAAVMNFFRIPLNVIVVVVLTGSVGVDTGFTCCAGFLLLALILHLRFRSLISEQQKLAADAS